MRINETCFQHLIEMLKSNSKMILGALLILSSSVLCYDPSDSAISTVLPLNGTFEAFYPKRAFGVDSGSSRASHGHGSFYKHRNPALVDIKNAPAYGFRFDGYRRFNFD